MGRRGPYFGFQLPTEHVMSFWSQWHHVLNLMNIMLIYACYRLLRNASDSCFLQTAWKNLFSLVYWTSSHYIFKMLDWQHQSSPECQKGNFQNWVGRQMEHPGCGVSEGDGGKPLPLLPDRQTIEEQPALWALWRAVWLLTPPWASVPSPVKWAQNEKYLSHKVWQNWNVMTRSTVWCTHQGFR